MKRAAVLYDKLEPGYLATKYALIDLGFEVSAYENSDDLYNADNIKATALVVVRTDERWALEENYMACLRENLPLARIIAVAPGGRISECTTAKDAFIEMGANAFVRVRENLLVYREKLQKAVKRAFDESEALSTHKVSFRRMRYGAVSQTAVFRRHGLYL